jgi:release factor glutamine methyltransferase
MMNLAINESPGSEAGPETIRRALTGGVESLSAAGIESARLDAEVLLRDALSIGRTELYLRLDDSMSVEDQSVFRSLLQRRMRHEPVAYITGRQEFWSFNFQVTPDVLIPRPETERLVETALQVTSGFPADLPLRILDIGTGSGVLAVTLAKELPQAQVFATDISLSTAALARANAARHGLSERINFVVGDLLEGICIGMPFNVIITNPPYVRSRELATLSPEIKDWEPHLALDGGTDGLDFYRRIASQANSYLVPGGVLLLEIGFDMAQDVLELFNAQPHYERAQIVRDYAGKDRVIVIRRIPGEIS